MKINTQNRGSFGIPPEMQEAMERSKKAEEKPREPEAPLPPLPDAEVAKDNEEFVKEISATSRLKEIGVVVDDKDFDTLLFKGYIEKDISVVEGKITPSFKTLITEEYDTIDELLAEELAAVSMTRDGADVRKTMWGMAMAVTKINGKPTVKAIMKEGNEVDLKATAKARRKVLSQMSPFVIDEMTRKFAVFTAAIRSMVNNPKELLKNS
jgi:hypothetical protein